MNRDIIIGAEYKPDLSSFKDSFKSHKLPTPIPYTRATENGFTVTKEGIVSHSVGDAVLSANGAEWPIAAATFATTYNDNGDGTCSKKKIEVTLFPVNERTQVQAQWGLLTAQVGDYVVQDGLEYWVLSKSDYESTYAQP